MDLVCAVPLLLKANIKRMTIMSGCAFIGFLASFLSKMEYKTGSTISVRMVAEISPPTTTVANGL